MTDAVDTQNLDAPPVNGLEGISVLPDEIASDPRILGWYNEQVSQLRREAAGIPMQSTQYTLMERIAYLYAYMRYQEFNNPNLPDRTKQANQDAWQKMLDQFNRLLEKHNDKRVDDMLLKVQDIIKAGLSIVTDLVERQALLRHMVEEFANLDI